jgi:hypothetical protein
MRCWFVLALAGCGFNPSSGTSDAGGSDAGVGSDASPMGSRTLTVDLGNTHGELDAFPLLVRLDSTRVVYADVPDPTTGFTFTDPSGATLEYDVDHWDPTGTSALWVRVLAIPTTGTTLTMTYGAGQHQAQSLRTWSGFTQVLHFDTAAVADSVGAAFAPMPTNVTPGPGQIGDAGGFADASSFVNFGNGTQLYNGWSSFTLDFWLYLDYASQPGSNVNIMNRGGPLAYGIYTPFVDTGDFAIDWMFGLDTALTMYIPVPLQQWAHIGVTWDGTTIIGWLNGNMPFSMSPPIIPNSLASDANASDSFSLGLGLTGSLDELELDRAVHPIDWIPAEYKSQTDQAITFGP